MADDDDGYEDWGWGDYEPTEQEQLQVYITDDATDPDSELLAWRQAQRWERLAARIEDNAENAQQYIKKARKGSGGRRPTWWKLWSPPELKETGGRPHLQGEDPRLVKQGDLSVRQEIKFRDEHSLYGGSYQPLRLIEDHQMWMEFQPDELYPGFPDLRFMGDRVTGEMMNGPWGFWDNEHGRFRSRIWGARTYRSQTRPELVTDFAVQMVQPPPYGLWLPTIVDYERNTDA